MAANSNPNPKPAHRKHKHKKHSAYKEEVSHATNGSPPRKRQRKSSQQRLPQAGVSPHKFTQGEISSIIVGAQKEKFIVYRDLLAECSAYFRACVRPAWNTSVLYIQDTDAATFCHFVNWLFMRTLPPIKLAHMEGLQEIVSLYRLADYLIVEALQNDIMDAVITYLEDKQWALNFEVVSYIRDENLAHTALFKLALKSAVRMFVLAPQDFKDGKENDLSSLKGNTELLEVILSGVRDYLAKPFDQVWESGRCEYHEHQDETWCE